MRPRRAADTSFEEAPELDTIIVPGGMSLRLDQDIVESVAAFLRRRAGSTRRMLSVCTGIYAYGAAGLPQGRHATTHWGFAQDVARRLQGVQLDCNSIYVRDYLMLAHLDGDLSLESLVGRVGLGARHFSRAFERTFGVGPREFRRRFLMGKR